MLRTIAAKKEIRLEAAVPQDLPHAHADPHRVKQVLNNPDEKVLTEIWNILKFCIPPDLDLVLPRMGRTDTGEVIFILACSPPQGINAMIRRIQSQLRQCVCLQESGPLPVISPVSRDLLCEDNPLLRHWSVESPQKHWTNNCGIVKLTVNTE